MEERVGSDLHGRQKYTDMRSRTFRMARQLGSCLWVSATSLAEDFELWPIYYITALELTVNTPARRTVLDRERDFHQLSAAT